MSIDVDHILMRAEEIKFDLRKRYRPARARIAKGCDWSRFQRAWDLRQIGLTYKAIGRELGSIKDGTPLSVEHVRQMVHRVDRRRRWESRRAEQAAGRA